MNAEREELKKLRAHLAEQKPSKVLESEIIALDAAIYAIRWTCGDVKKAPSAAGFAAQMKEFRKQDAE
jgi:hypothetical protein